MDSVTCILCNKILQFPSSITGSHWGDCRVHKGCLRAVRNYEKDLWTWRLRTPLSLVLRDYYKLISPFFLVDEGVLQYYKRRNGLDNELVRQVCCMYD